MLSVVTGANGLVGVNLVRALLDRGDRVRVIDKRKTEALAGLDVERIQADVRDYRALEKAFAGADTVFHLAAVISIVGDPTGEVRSTNVDGPRNASRAALACGVKRFVHCSSVHAFDLEYCGPELSETAVRATGLHAPVYDRSKNAGENQVRAAIAEGLDAVVVNPSGIIGPNDHGPSRIGELLIQMRDRTLPVNIRGAFDFVDVRDVVAGMLSAERRGRTGENYILSGHRLKMGEIAELAEKITGAGAPRISMPISIITGLAPLFLRFTAKGETPLITPDSVHAVRYSPSICHYKASTELGYVARPLLDTMRDTYAWFEEYMPPNSGSATRKRKTLAST
ncbi:MAG: NAD-dependent epimerase/dehydratase family protein [Polyangiales bacterium]